MLGAAVLALSLALAAVVGFAAARGGVCAVRAIDGVVNGRGAELFVGFLKCSVWVFAVTLALAWTAVPDARLAFGYPLTWEAAAGGFVFGLGAAANGGCAFSTVTDLGAGDLGAPAAFLGIGLGALLHGTYVAPLLPVRVPAPSVLMRPEPWSAALLLAAAAWAAFELAALLRRRRRRPEIGAAMAAIGVAGGALYALHGPWVYTVVLAQGAAWAARIGPPPSALLPALFAALVAGAALSAWSRGRFELRRPGAIAVARRLAGGSMMGAGAALVPGGNDVLVLHALPGLAPHAPLAYAALVTGVATVVLAARMARRGGAKPARAP